jgi:hypothetical protein
LYLVDAFNWLGELSIRMADLNLGQSAWNDSWACELLACRRQIGTASALSKAPAPVPRLGPFLLGASRRRSPCTCILSARVPAVRARCEPFVIASRWRGLPGKEAWQEGCGVPVYSRPFPRYLVPWAPLFMRWSYHFDPLVNESVRYAPKKTVRGTVFRARPYRMIWLRHRHFLVFVPLFSGWYVPRYGCAIFAIATVPLDFALMSGTCGCSDRALSVGLLRYWRRPCRRR